MGLESKEQKQVDRRGLVNIQLETSIQGSSSCSEDITAMRESTDSESQLERNQNGVFESVTEVSKMF